MAALKCISRLQRVVRSNSVRYDLSDKDCTFWSYYNMEIMGNNQFTSDVMKQSLNEIEVYLPNYKIDWVKSITFNVGNEYSWLRLYHGFNEADLEEYTKRLGHIRSGSMCDAVGDDVTIALVVPSLFDIEEKEIDRAIRGYDSYRYYTARSCIWWDLDNHVMFSFDKTMINKVPHLIKNTF